MVIPIPAGALCAARLTQACRTLQRLLPVFAAGVLGTVVTGVLGTVVTGVLGTVTGTVVAGVLSEALARVQA